MTTETMPSTEVHLRTSVVAVAATSTAGFMHVLPALGLGADVRGIRSVLIVGVAKLSVYESFFAPTTGLIGLEDLKAEAIRRACRAASAATSSLSTDVASRHCACSGWRDARLREALSAHDCQTLFVHPSDVPPRRRRGLRRRLADAGVSLVVVGAESRGGDGS